MNNAKKEKNILMFNTILISMLIGLILSLSSILLKLSEVWTGVLFVTPALIGFFLCLVVQYVEKANELYN